MAAPNPRRTAVALVAGVVSAAIAIAVVARSGGGAERAALPTDPGPVRTAVELARRAPVRLDDVAAVAPSPAAEITSDGVDAGQDTPSLTVRLTGLAVDAGSARVLAHAEAFRGARGERPRASRIEGDVRGEELVFAGFPSAHTATVVVTFEDRPVGAELRFDVQGPNAGDSRAERTFDLAAVRAAENEAIEVLRTLAEVQSKCASAASLDADGDGVGEFATIAQLLELGASGGIDPALDFGEPTASDEGAFYVRGDYAFRVFLPAAGTPPFTALGDSVGGGSVAPQPSTDGSEAHWCAYAWPLDTADLPRRAFFVGRTREVFAQANGGPEAYAGGNGPLSDAALARPGDMGAPPVAPGERASDGRPWVRLGR